MNANFLRPEIMRRETAFINEFNSSLPKYSDADLTFMIHDSWRPQKVAAWVIGLKRLEGMEAEVAKELDRLNGYYTEHLVMSIILIGSENGAKILEDYLKTSLLQEELDLNSMDRMATTIRWAIYGLEVLRDRSCDSGLLEHSDVYELWSNFPQRWWSKVSANWPNAPEQVEKKWLENWGLSVGNEVENILEFCKSNFGYKI